MIKLSVGTNEFLIIGKRGKLHNYGSAITKIIFPWEIYHCIPATKQEVSFELTQESQDGIPLRFKGIIIFRIQDPLTACKFFDFNKNQNDIHQLLKNIAMGELRAIVSYKSMKECIEERKTTLTKGIWNELNIIIENENWGIHIEMCQVAQVYIVDENIRQQLESSVRNQIHQDSELSNIQTKTTIEKAKLLSDKEVQIQNNLNQKNNIQLILDLFQKEKEAEQNKMEISLPIENLRITNNLQLAKNENLLLRTQLSNEKIKNEIDFISKISAHKLKMEALPIEQRTKIAESLSNLFNGTNLSIFDTENNVIGWIEVLFSKLLTMNTGSKN
ncbi:MAG: hypothetical protein CL609_23485 [Anaerolineaceae bacterium]|nr:hypothetical protein [Anaerolineaceae bacterium]